MSIYRSDIDAALMMAYLDGQAGSDALLRLAAASGGAAGFQAEADALSRLEALLRETGAARNAALAKVDLVDAVMQAVHAGTVPVDDPEDGIVPDRIDPQLEAALTETAGALAGALPQVDLLGGVMRGLAHMKNREMETGEAATNDDAALALLAVRVEDVGREIREKTPPVEIVEPVMESVARERQTPGQNVIPFRARPRVPRQERVSSGMRLWAFRAAAVLILGISLAGGLVIYRAENGRNGAGFPNVAELKGNSRMGARKAWVSAQRPGAPKYLPKNDSRVKGYAEIVRPSAPIPLTLETKSGLASLTMDEVLAAKRGALAQKGGSADKLAGWGNLTADEARRLLEEGGLSNAAMLGAIQALPPEEAANYLRAAVEKSPDDPYLRYMLARNLMGNPATQDEAKAQIAAMKDLAGNNALPYYMDASAKLSQGDINGALLAMDLGAGLETANPYGLETAQNRAAALQAGGMAADVARFLVATTAGQAEYNDLMNLSQNLMAYGQEYENIKDYETANSIYNAVQTLGVQIQQGATLTNERLAGYDVEMTALDAVARLADVLKTPQGMQFIEGAYNVLAGSLSGFMNYLVGLGDMIAGVPANQAGALGQQILTQGDLNLPVPTTQQ